MIITYLVIEEDGDGWRRLQVRYCHRRDLLARLHEHCGGYVDVTRTKDGQVVWVNDEGLLNGLPRNKIATHLVYGTQRAIAVVDPNAPEWIINLQANGDPLYIAGNCVLTGPPDGQGNSTSVDLQTIIQVISIMQALVEAGQ